MPGFGDSAFIVLLALLLFGPKKLPVLARQLGKLMGDFRRASNEFRAQMEDELRISEQAEKQKQIAAIEASAPKPALPESRETPAVEPYDPEVAFEQIRSQPEVADVPAPLPIAESGDLKIMPPATGLPVPSSSLSPWIDSIPSTAAPETSHNGNGAHNEAAHQTVPPAETEAEAKPWMI